MWKPPQPETGEEREARSVLAHGLEAHGANVMPDTRELGVSAFIATFQFEQAKTTIRIVLGDPSGADVAITNMTTLPHDVTGKGFGTRAISELKEWAIENNLKNIRAVQVQTQSENFWTKNGFAKCPTPNPTNDFVFVVEPTTGHAHL